MVRVSNAYFVMNVMINADLQAIYGALDGSIVVKPLSIVVVASRDSPLL